MLKKMMAGLALLWIMVTGVAVQAAELPPDLLVKNVTNDVLAIVRQDQAIQSGDTKRAIDLVEEKVLPHFDFRHMTMLAVGRDWRQANPDQRTRLVDSFKSLLVRTYSNALTQYKDQVIDFKPLHADAAATDVTVRTSVRQAGAQPIDIDYSLEKNGADWKVYDVVVAGVSLVTNYRGSFAQEVQKGGIDGLIASLDAKNKQIDVRH